MILTIIESPYAGKGEALKRNIEYARQCVKDSLNKNESPIASHLLYTQPGILDDTVKKERDLGINAGLEWRRVAQRTAVYTDFGLTAGMEYGIMLAEEYGVEIVYRSLYNNVAYDFVSDLINQEQPHCMEITPNTWDFI